MKKRVSVFLLLALLLMKGFSYSDLQNETDGGDVFFNVNIGGAFGIGNASGDYDWNETRFAGNGFAKSEFALYFWTDWLDDPDKFLGLPVFGLALFVDANLKNYLECGVSVGTYFFEAGWSYSVLKESNLYAMVKPRFFLDTSGNKYSVNLFPFIGIDCHALDIINDKGQVDFVTGLEVGISFNSRNRRVRQSKGVAERNAKRDREYRLKLEEEDAKRKAAAEERRKAMEEEKASDYEAVSKLNTVLAWRSFNGKWGISGKSLEIDKILLNQYEIDSILDLNIGHNTNPYGLRKDVLYYTYGISVVQWLSPESFLADIDSSVSILGRGKVKIHIRNCYAFNAENIENLSVVNDSCYHVYLRYNGTFSYNSAAQVYETVPSFDIVLFY